jgi:hypothetical protein
MSEYNLDADAAKQADTGGGRITETGKYVGQFTVAKKVLSKKGTQGIEFSFESNAGQSADYLSMWTINQDGDHIFGFKQLMALMTCLRVRGIDTSMATVEEYDRDTNGKVKRQLEVYKDLMHKPIGILLQMEEYEKKDGSAGAKPVFAGFFDPKTEQVATEILDKLDPRILEKQVSQLTPLRRLKGARSAAAAGQPALAGASFDDDIPFAPISRKALLSI